MLIKEVESEEQVINGQSDKEKITVEIEIEINTDDKNLETEE